VALRRFNDFAPPAAPATLECVRAVQAYIEREGLQAGDRLPPERELMRELSVTRGRLRLAMACMARDGVIWRHVGKGTFLSQLAASRQDRAVFRPPPLDRTNPMDLLLARLRS